MFRAVKSSKDEQWRTRFKRFDASGLSVTRFCQLEGISMPSFYQWRKRLRASTVNSGDSGVPTFLPVRITPSPLCVVEIHLPNGTRICIPPEHSESLRIVIETASRLADEKPEADAC